MKTNSQFIFTPNSFFQGTYVAHVTVTDNASGEELQCFDLEMDVRLVEEPECTGWFCMFG